MKVGDVMYNETVDWFTKSSRGGQKWL